MTVRKKALVSGGVQGVFYRDTCRRVARGAGVAGTAVNLADGRVEIVMEGSDEGVQKVLDWCRNGPSGARVESVEVTDENPEGLQGFSIL